MEKRKSFVACSLVKENPTNLNPFEASLKARQSEDDNHDDTSTLGNNRPSDAHHSKGQGTVLRCLHKDAMNIHDMHEKPGDPETILDEGDCGRERLKRHRIEMAGRVWIPDIWGQEELLKDWIDCSAFDSSLVPGGIMSARASLVEEGRRANSGALRIQYRC
ncbi:hypothetical protein K2173_012106 [Erythroxylum novogranatense]|uniref:Protein BIC1 n=1 Tax=Erythroxylum novogranatense TaxID=1862640 RepID=A0AAV8SR02_9ROSI|nr:hypothetical protein K2173_012106 [Erythroxylum novogranatense]